MKICYFPLLWFLFVCPQKLDATCEAKQRAIEEDEVTGNLYSVCLKDPCNPIDPTPVNQSDSCPKWCVRVMGVCYSKQLPSPPPVKNNMASALLILAQVENEDSGGDGRRLLPVDTGVPNIQNFPFQSGFEPGYDPQTTDLFSSILMGYGYERFNFPHNCRIDLHDQKTAAQLLQPPLNVPYCIRIACKPSDPSLEFDFLRCLANPGCYFDHELAFRRRGVSGALAGVPVCHLAIRNKNFQRLANDYVQRTGRQWNTLHTQCLIEQNVVAIENPDPGCFALKYLHHMGGHPKVAGWKSINRRNCFLINGCWLPSIDEDYNCFYPAGVDEVQVRSDDRFSSRFPSQYEMFGRPMCRPFNSATPEAFLTSYHQCKLAGCSTDSSITLHTLRDKLMSVMYSDEVPENLRYTFWLGVQKRSITPGNYQKKLAEMKRSSSCPGLPNLLSISEYSQLDAFEFSTRYFNSVVRPLKQNLLGSNDAGSTPGRTTPLHCLLFASQAATKHLFDTFCSGIGEVAHECPYSIANAHLTGYPALTGSVEGCCEKHLCYIPRQLVKAQRSGVASFYLEWGEWGECSVSCGGGIKKRERNCEKHAYAPGAVCMGVNEESEPCNSHPCPYWDPWEEFGACSKTCGDGLKLRRRNCVNLVSPGVGCEGIGEESSPCYIHPCPVYGKWSGFSECPCSAPRIRIRHRECVTHCTGQDVEEEEEPCTRFCGRWECQPETTCRYPTCRHHFRCVCRPESFLCDGGEPPTERCYDGLCRFF